MSRQSARANAVKLVYEYTILKQENELTFKSLTHNESAEDRAFTKTLYEGVLEHFNELKEIVAERSKGFTSERIFNMDLSVLLVALYEIKYQPDIPPLVSINEAVELCRTYSTEKSHVFVNGILHSVVSEL